MHFSSEIEITAQQIDYALEVIINFTNHFRSANMALTAKLVWAKPIND